MTIVHPSHEDLLQDVCKQVKAGKGKMLSVRKPHVSHTPRTVDYKKDCCPIDMSRLTRILEVNAEEGWAHVEGLVTIESLVKVTLEYGLIPRVCPEIRAFTVAGLINGRGLQTSSHKYGMFEMKDNIIETEVVLGDGSVIVCDENNHSEFFLHLKGSYGTLGFVTAAKVRLTPATKVVKSHYHVFDKLDEFCSFTQSQIGKPHFLDGVVFSRDHAVAIVSDFVEGVPEGQEDKVFHPLYPERPGGMYYYQYVKLVTKGKTTYSDFIPTQEFIHRSERGLWWMTEAMLDDEQLCSVRPFRAFLDKETQKQYKTHGFNDHILTRNEARRTLVAQDQGFRVDRVHERLNWCIDNIGVFPIWTCYIRLRDGMGEKWAGQTHIADIGLYGFASRSSYRCQRDLRNWQLSADAPAVWGESYLTVEETGINEEFGPKLRALREKYKAVGAFKKIEDKISFYDKNEPDLGGPMPFFRLRRLWRYSKKILLCMAVVVPLIKLGFLVSSILNLGLAVVKLPFLAVRRLFKAKPTRSSTLKEA